jgi:hypothetical protein
MADPTPFTPGYSFTDWQTSNPTKPLPGNKVDQDMANIETSIDEIVDAIKDVRRSDGKLKNGIVTVDSLDPTVAAGVGAGALASAEAAAASADAAGDSADAAASSAVASAASATAASGYASTALTYRNAASGFADDSAAAATLSQTARDFANKWAVEAEGVDVNDGVNPVGKSAYHWAQVALEAATGALPDNSVSMSKIVDGAVTSAKIADGALSADTTGRAKMADGFTTTAKLANGVLSADTTGRAKMADGFLSADTTGRAKMADGFLTAVKAAADFVFGQTAKTTPVDADALLISDSAASNVPKKLTFANLKAWVRSFTAINSIGSTATTTGTTVEFNAIPANVRRVTVVLSAVSLSSTSSILVQLGTASSFETTSYISSAAAARDNSTTVGANSAAGFIIALGASATVRVYVTMTITRVNGNEWVCSYSGGLSDGTTLVSQSTSGGGNKTLSGELTRLRLNSVSGTDTFDNGTANVFYEF